MKMSIPKYEIDENNKIILKSLKNNKFLNNLIKLYIISLDANELRMLKFFMCFNSK